ncbi:MAG: CCA tRNA nucleotidyltransferase [Candidatus Methanomethylophilaceae archaeon]|nr:CCA tRNA nucleotidyltransferase [Candidatus Methanomethylophilaceae archaeon]
MTIESDVLSEIKPTPEESAEILAKARRLQEAAERYLSERNIKAKVRFVGSVGKGTFLRNPDIDLFILYSPKIPRPELERLGLQAGKDLIGGIKMYAEHPYTSGKFEGLDVDLVPCYELESAEHILTAVDRTPFHADFVLSHSDDRIKDEIRLMKCFMKGIGTYGAEPDVRGFTGYLCELLVIRYGGFIGALKAAADWKKGAQIWIGNRGKPLKGALVFYDPVDPNRNVASAVHEDTLCKYIHACKCYLRSPDRRFFFPELRKLPSRDELADTWSKRGTGLVSVSFVKPDIIPENLHAQMWKTQYGIGKKLNEYGFGVLRAEHCEDEKEAHIVFELERFESPKLVIHKGPPAYVENAESFLEKWKDNPDGAPYLDDGFWMVVCPPQFPDAASMIVKEAHHSGVGRELSVESMTVRGQKDVIDSMDPSVLAQLFDPKMPWEN